MRIYNLDAIIRIEIKDKSKHNYLVFEPSKSGIFGFFKTEEGFYHTHSVLNSTCYSKNELITKGYNGSKLLVDENNIVYYAPSVIIKFFDGHKEIKEFDTFEEANKWGRDIANKSISNQLID